MKKVKLLSTCHFVGSKMDYAVSLQIKYLLPLLGRLLIIYSAFVKCSTENGNTVKQCVSSL